MKQLFNYCIVPGYETDIWAGGAALDRFLMKHGLDGVELRVWQKEPMARVEQTVGVHLNYYPMWLDFYRGNAARVERFFPTDEARRAYYGADSRRGWLDAIRANIRNALVHRPEYLVWHVGEETPEEAYTWRFKYSDREVVRAAADLFNEIAGDVPKDMLVLFENLWWPGLRLTDEAIAEEFFSRVQHARAGILLDTGHLMNTNADITTEEEGIDYICRTIDRIGIRERIRGIHLNCSLSGDYVKSFERVYHEETTAEERYRHIAAIDQHQPFTTEKVQDILRLVNPDYVVHELTYRDLIDLEDNIKTQTKCLRGYTK